MTALALSRNKHKNDSIDMIAVSFRQTIEPDSCVYESHYHRVLISQESTPKSMGEQLMFAYHIHGTTCKTKRSYERFEVKKEAIMDLVFIGQTAFTSSEIEGLCEVNLGVPQFSKNLDACYEWPKGTLDILMMNRADGINKLYVGYLHSHSCMSACSQFVSY